MDCTIRKGLTGLLAGSMLFLSGFARAGEAADGDNTRVCHLPALHLLPYSTCYARHLVYALLSRPAVGVGNTGELVCVVAEAGYLSQKLRVMGAWFLTELRP